MNTTCLGSNTIISDALKRAKLLETLARFDKAVEVYRSLMSEHPRDFRAFFNCARILALQESTLEESLYLFQLVIDLDQSVIEAYSASSAVLIKLNRPFDAACQCRAGLLIENSDRNCLYNLNIALRQSGLIVDAISLCWNRLESLSRQLPGIESQDSRSWRCTQDAVSETSNFLTIVCVKWGSKYGADYVNNLYYAVQRHLSGPELQCRQFVCFTDDATGIDKNISCLPFEAVTHSWQGWWLKAQIFAHCKLLCGWILYIDLDTVVCDSLLFLRDLIVPTSTGYGVQQSDIIHSESKLYVLAAQSFKNEARKVGLNSSLLLWHSRNTILQSLFGFLRSHYAELTKVIYKFDHYLEMMLYKHLLRPLVATVPSDGDACALPEYRSIADFYVKGGGPCTIQCCYFQDHCPHKIIDYFEHLEQESDKTETLPISPTYKHGLAEAMADQSTRKSSIICFPLKPKPHQLLDDSFIRVHWLGEDLVVSTGETID